MSETNPLRRRITSSVPFTLHIEDEQGVQELGLRVALNLNSFCLFEEVTGINVLQNLGVVFDKPNVSIVSALLWAGLQENHADQFDGPEGLSLLRANLTMDQIKVAKATNTAAFLVGLPEKERERLSKAAEEAAKARAEGKSPNA